MLGWILASSTTRRVVITTAVTDSETTSQISGIAIVEGRRLTPFEFVRRYPIIPAIIIATLLITAIIGAVYSSAQPRTS